MRKWSVHLVWRKLLLVFPLIILWGLSLQPSACVSAANYGVYVQDKANILTEETKQVLYDRAVWLQKQKHHAQIGIVTLSHLPEGQTLEEMAVTVFRTLGLGGAESNNGVLLLFDAKSGHVRLEVGYGLEGILPDGKAGSLLDQHFLPNLKSKKLEVSFLNTQSAILQEIAVHYHLDTSKIEKELPFLGPPKKDKSFLHSYFELLTVIAVMLLIFIDFKLTGGAFTLLLFQIFRKGGGGGRGGGGLGGSGGGGSSGGGGATR